MKLTGLFFLLALLVVSECTISPSDQSALVDFFNSLTATGDLTWDTNVDLCRTSNSGVFNFVPAVVCNSQDPQRVVGLILNSKKLSGELDGSLAKLSFLQTIVLSDNDFSGVIPDFSPLGTLSALILANNAFSGAIPSSLADISSLNTLDLSGNDLVGPIPTELGLLANLNQLLIGANPLDTSLPTELGNLASLFSLDASSSSLTGPIPTEIFSLPNLESLYLAKNSLTGGLPTHIGLATNLNIFDVNSNSALGGSIPIQIGDMSNLGSIDLSGCGLTDSIPTQVGFLTNLDTFMASNNNLSGQIPSQFVSIPYLAYLELDFNSLSGTVPNGLSSIPNFQVLYLSGGSNSFCPLPNYGTWAKVTDFPGAQDCSACNPTPCSNGGTCTFINNAFGCSCPTPYYGNTCQNTFTCPVNYRNNADYPVTPGGSVATGVCSLGFGGSPTRACGPTGIWSPTTNNNCVKVCQASVAKNATFLQTVNDNTATGTCDPGLVGTVTRYCYTNGTWGPIIGACTVLMCDPDNTGTGNANWAATKAGSTASGTCLSGYAGSPIRQCQNDGSWASVNNPCTKVCPVETAFLATWPVTSPNTVAGGNCTVGFQGSPTRLCQNDGTWATSLTDGSCLPLRCPVEFYAHTNFTEGGTPGQWVNGTCERGYFGYGARFCQSNGVWSNNFGVRCTPHKCQPVNENHVDWPLTMFDLIVNRNCPAGYTGRPSRTCGDDGNWGPITNPCISI